MDVETQNSNETIHLRQRLATLAKRNAALEDAERKRLQVEDELRESQKLYRALVETDFARAYGSYETLLAEEELERNKKAHTDQLEAMVQERTAELEEAHAKLIQSEKLAAVGRLAAGVAHEINNPVGVLLMKLKFLLSVAPREELTPKAVDTLHIAVEQTERIVRIVEGLLNFSRTPVGRSQPLDLNECVHSSLQLAHRLLADHHIDLVLELGADLPRILGDPVEFEQVLINLLNNAVEAMTNGDRLRLVSRLAGEQVIVSVEDSGKGIRTEDIDSIFDPFFTTKDFGEGTGLGLSISYGIVQKMGGRIEVESQPGSGATFRVVLPVEGS